MDPVVTGGCPFCGTFLYVKKSEQVRNKAVTTGRNAQVGPFSEKKFVRCGHCGFVCNMDRDIKYREGSKSGWGLKYTKTIIT